MGVKIYSDSAGSVEIIAEDNANNAVVTIPNPTGGGDTELITAASLNVSKVIDTGAIADSAVETLQINDGAVTDAKITGMDASKLSGDLPAISGAALTGISAGFSWGTTGGYSSGGSSSDAYTAMGSPGAGWYIIVVVSTDSAQMVQDGLTIAPGGAGTYLVFLDGGSNTFTGISGDIRWRKLV